MFIVYPQQQQDTMEYAIVIFTDSNQVEIVSTSWFDGTSCCLWPNFTTNSKISKAIRAHEPPDVNWKSYPVRKLMTTGMFIET